MKPDRKRSSSRPIETLTKVFRRGISDRAIEAGTAAQNRLPWLIRMVPPQSLKPAERNVRTHSKKQVRLIAQSIKRYGVINPVVTDRHGRVAAGHARLEASLQLGLPFIPVIQVDHLSETELRAYALADNALGDKSGWDRDLLAIELSELTDLLPAQGMDICLTGFEPAEVDLLLADMAAPAHSEPEDLLPALPQTPVTRRGDLWQLGKHRVLCADSRDADSFARLADGMAVAAVLCDVPYNLRVSSIGGRGRVRHSEFAFGSGEMTPAEYRNFLTTTLFNGVRISLPGAVHYVFIDWRHVDVVMEVGRELFDSMLNLVVWNKTNAGQGSFYRSQHELICVFRVAGQTHRNNIELGRFGRNRSNVWTYPGVNSFGHGRMEALASHPTVKPVTLVADAILDCTARGEAVLDQFAGSGTTILAAEKVGRVGFGIECDPRYVDVAVQRWLRWTKLEAILVDDGRTFDQVAEERAGGRQEPQMAKRRAPTAQAYAVGYRRPPKSTQFKPGVSGNPKGKPKGSRPVGALLQEIIRQKIAVNENGKTRRLPVLEIMLRRLANDAMRGEQRSIKFLLSLLEHYSDSSQTTLQLGEMLAEDAEILAEYLDETAVAEPRPSTPEKEPTP